MIARSRLALASFTIAVFQDVARLAFESFANCVESREPNRLGLAVLQDGDVGHRDADSLGQLGDAHLPLGQHDVDVNDD